MYTRLSKVSLVLAVGLYVFLAAFNNITDYDSNYQFVVHVLKLDTPFPNNQGMSRAITSANIHYGIYIFITSMQVVIAALCWLGGLRLARVIHNAACFNKAKNVAILGLTLGIILWFTGFISIGGEWFLMWQSESWNGQQAAFRLAVLTGIVLVYLVQPDHE